MGTEYFIMREDEILGVIEEGTKVVATRFEHAPGCRPVGIARN